MKCKICGVEKSPENLVTHYPSKRGTFCAYCAEETPAKVDYATFVETYFGVELNKVKSDDRPIYREFYSDYLASTHTLAEYVSATISSIITPEVCSNIKWYDDPGNVIGLAEWLHSEVAYFSNIDAVLAFFAKPWKWGREYGLYELDCTIQKSELLSEAIRNAIDDDNQSADRLELGDWVIERTTEPEGWQWFHVESSGVGSIPSGRHQSLAGAATQIIELGGV